MFNAVIWVGGVLALFHLCRPYVERALSISERRVALAERRADHQEEQTKRSTPPQPEAPPADLVALALSESSTWAQEDALKHMYELYAEFKDWKYVRGMLINESVQNG